MKDLLNLPTLNLIIISVTTLLALGIIFLVIKEINISIGNKSISFKGAQGKTIVKVVTDYADFKYKLRGEEEQGLKDIQTRAQRTTRNHCGILIRMITEVNYNVSQELKTPKKKALTGRILPVILSECESVVFKTMMEIFDENHLVETSDDSFLVLIKDRYKQVYLTVKSFLREFWLPDFYPYEVFEEGMKKERDNLFNLFSKVMKEFKHLATQKVMLKETIEKYDSRIKEYVLQHGKLPENCLAEVDGVYSKLTGLRKDLV